MKNNRKLSIIAPLNDFVKQEAFGGILIVCSAALGLIFANSGLGNFYDEFLHTGFSLKVSSLSLEMDLGHLINDGLMTIFFFLVGLEIKRELVAGHLSTLRQAIPSAIAALGGMVVPALIFLLIANSESRNGWGVAVATDIALALGILTLAGNGAKPSLRPFLLGLAVIDDVGAILIIAIVYSSGVSMSWLIVSILSVGFVILFRKTGMENKFAYIFVGLVLWLSLYKAGVHPTLAGVILGLLTPASPFFQPEYIDQEELANLQDIDHVKESQKIIKGSISTVEWLEHAIHPWSAYFIVPLFAFANSGIEITKSGLTDSLNSKLFWAVFFGLLVGKPIGIFLSTLAIKRAGIGELPRETNLKDIFATGTAAGIGFTVAIFISKLAFEEVSQQEQAILGVLCTSLISGLLSLWLFRAKWRPE